MKRTVMFSVLAIVMLLNVVVPCATASDNGFAIGPAQLNVTVPENGNTTTYVYVTSFLDGELIVGTENLSFRIEPGTIPIDSTYRSQKIAINVYGNDSLANGQYSGKITFLLQTGNNVAHGIKISTNITQEIGESEPNGLLNEFIKIVQQNYLLIIVVVVVIVALISGIYIGKRSKKENEDA